MLTISRSQMKSVEMQARLRFISDMETHLADFSPALAAAVGPAQWREFVLFGVARAEGHGFSLRGPTRLYLESMLLFGSHFDTDPQYPWAAERLAVDRTMPEMQRAEHLYDAVMAYRRAVAGPQDVHAIEALRRIAAVARAPLPVSPATVVADVMWQIRLVYPRKAAYTGDAAIEALVTKAVDGAQRQAFDPVRGVVLVSLLMLAFGHGCGADPLYPWIAATLRDERIVDPAAREARLERKSLTWLTHVLAHFDGKASAR